MERGHPSFVLEEKRLQWLKDHSFAVLVSYLASKLTASWLGRLVGRGRQLREPPLVFPLSRPGLLTDEVP